MKYKLLFISFLLLSSVYAQNTDNKIVIGKIDSVYSNIIGEQRKIWVYVPQEVMTQYLVKNIIQLYILWMVMHIFIRLMGMIQQLSEVKWKYHLP